MITDLKPYPEYRESGVPWLGRVPNHWQQRRMKFLFQERVQKGFPDEPLLAATQSKGVVSKEDYGARTVTAMKDFHLLKLVETGDFVISLRSFEGGIEMAHCRGIISPAYTILIPKHEVHQSYYSHFFKSPDFISSLTLFVTGIREGQNINYERLSRAYMPLPPIEEQTAIGLFLNWATRRLEWVIRAKRKVIALLNEQKQAIINRAVIRGLDLNVCLKPSGIEWLGDVPEHWEVRRLKSIARIAGRIGFRGYTTDNLVEPGEGALALGATHIRSDGEIDLSSPVFISWDKYYESPEIMVRQGDILIVQRGSTSGKIGYIRNDIGMATINPSLILISDIRDCAEFVFLALTCPTVRSYFNSLLSSTAIPMLSQYQVGNTPLAIPPTEEQRTIVEEVRIRTQPAQSSIERTLNEISLLREYRTRLIADVITGKLDVREAAANLPDEMAVAPLNDDPDLSDETELGEEEAVE